MEAKEQVKQQNGRRRSRDRGGEGGRASVSVFRAFSFLPSICMAKGQAAVDRAVEEEEENQE